MGPFVETYSLVNDEITLECRVRGTPRPNICWLKDGEYITPGDKYKKRDFVDQYSCKLIITAPDEFDNGTYSCEAECNGVSDTISHIVEYVPKDQVMLERTHRVYHRDPNKPCFYTGLAQQAIPSGGNIVLMVETTPNCEVEWFRERWEIKEKPPKIRFFDDHHHGFFAVSICAATLDGTYQ